MEETIEKMPTESLPWVPEPPVQYNTTPPIATLCEAVSWVNQLMDWFAAIPAGIYPGLIPAPSLENLEPELIMAIHEYYEGSTIRVDSGSDGRITVSLRKLGYNLPRYIMFQSRKPESETIITEDFSQYLTKNSL
jgi:hypothetical protein